MADERNSPITRREIVRMVLEGKPPPYVPWAFGFTTEAREKLAACGRDDLDDVLRRHLLYFGNSIGFFTDVGDNRFRDVFGVVWDRSIDKDIGIVSGCVLGAPTLKGYTFPDTADLRYFEGVLLC
jgi:uroporphyrinogen decarboxylase